MLRTLVSIHVWTLAARTRIRRHLADQHGQSTAEYALVLLGAAAVAMLLVAWATKTDKITRLLNSVIDTVLDQVP
jgi:Flp pilus assembly pilin Flp